MVDAAYVPIIVEATKFFFKEAAAWFSIARQRLADPSQPQQDDRQQQLELNVSEEQFSEAASNPSDLLALVDAHQAELLSSVISQVVDQLKIHYANLGQFQTREAKYGLEVPLQVTWGIKHESDSIVRKTQQLQELLKLIYR